MENKQPFVPPIVSVRGKRMVLASGAAMLYGTLESKLAAAVGRNPDRFPDDFMIRLSPAEHKAFKSRLAFTPEGLSMLAHVLDTPLARNGAVNMIRAFIMLDRMHFAGNGA